METIWETPLRGLPAGMLLAGGVYFVLLSFLRVRDGHRMPFGTPGKTLRTMQWMRLVLGGGSMIAIGAGWLLQIPVLAAAGLVIGFEETIETSIAASALADETRRDEADLRRQEISHG